MFLVGSPPDSHWASWAQTPEVEAEELDDDELEEELDEDEELLEELEDDEELLDKVSEVLLEESSEEAWVASSVGSAVGST